MAFNDTNIYIFYVAIFPEFFVHRPVELDKFLYISIWFIDGTLKVTITMG